MRDLERRITDLERRCGEGEIPRIYVIWSEEEREAIERDPGDTVKVVRWPEDKLEREQ
jgi:hypothetical protein